MRENRAALEGGADPFVEPRRRKEAVGATSGHDAILAHYERT